MPYKELKQLAQLRTSSHRFNIETGRHSQNRQGILSRICKICTSDDLDTVKLLSELSTSDDLDTVKLLSELSTSDDLDTVKLLSELDQHLTL